MSTLGQLNMLGQDKIDVAIERIKMFEPSEGYYLAFSGGKDSIVVKELMDMAEVKYDSHFNNTTVEPPGLIPYIIKNYPDVEIHQPEVSMWDLIPKKKMPPTRLVRYCCEHLKEGGGEGRFVVTGVRWSESNRRKQSRQSIEFDRYGSQSREAKERREIFLMSDNGERRRMIENCQVKGKHILNPIIEWTEKDVWQFIKDRKLNYCSLYDKGHDRIGCVGCPLAGRKQMLKEFEMYPKYRAKYVEAFDRMILERKKNNMKTEWENGEEVMQWWLSY